MRSNKSVIVLALIPIILLLLFILVKFHFPQFDKPPFILLNLCLSFQASYAAPVIMMSQNRQSVKDRRMAEQDYETNFKAEQKVQYIIEHLEVQHEILIHMLERVITDVEGKLQKEEDNAVEAKLQQGCDCS